MDIRQELLTDRSKKNIVRITDYIGSSTNRFEVLIDLFLNDEWLINQRAVWVMVHCVLKFPELIEPHLKVILATLKKPDANNAIKRNVTKILAEISISEDLQGEALDICFNFLLDTKEAIAVKVFSMQVVYNLSQKEPDLLGELAMILEDQLPYGSAGFKSRGMKILKEIRKKTWK